MSQRQQRESRQPTREARQPQGGAGTRFPRGAGVYPQDLVPAALAGDYVHLKPEGEIRQVEAVVVNPNIRAFDSNLGNSVTANSSQVTSDQQATELEQRDGWLAQYRMTFPGADIPSGIDRVLVDHGGAQAPLYTSKENRGHIDQDTAQLAGYSAATELYIWEQQEPQFSFDNGTGSNITIQDLRFAGFQFELGPTTQLPGNVQPVVVPTEALGSVG